MARQWTRDASLELTRSYQPVCVLAAAAELDLFRAIGSDSLTANAVADRLECDRRAMEVLLDALAALELVEKTGDAFSVPSSVAALLGQTGPGSVLASAQHQANCLRRWVDLARVVKSGRPAERHPSVRGAAADQDSFILAMNDLASAGADAVIRSIGALEFTCLLDVGGGSGTWTIAFLRACPSARAILFDLPAVTPLAEKRFAKAGVIERVTIKAGDFYRDVLPVGADLAWISAIVHQNSRAENRDLFDKINVALVSGGRIAIRDHLMEPSRTVPIAGALFAVNMLTGTAGGGTYTVEELRDDLEHSGFCDVSIAHREPTMNSILIARKR